MLAGSTSAGSCRRSSSGSSRCSGKATGSFTCGSRSRQSPLKTFESLAAITPAAPLAGAPASVDAPGGPTAPATTAVGGGGGGERFAFQAEVKRVLDIIVHSLYTDRDVFLRELVSNAADACDKKRVLLDQQPHQQQPHQQQWKGSIRVYADKIAGTLTVEDDGIGMTRQELIDHLGTIAQSGTYKFAQQLQQQQQEQKEDGEAGSASDLIGQFGVGFYSAFLVADKVEVVSSRWHPRDTERAAATAKGALPEIWKWSSSCGQTFSLRQLNANDEQQRWQQQTRELHRQLQQQAAKTAHTIPLEKRQQQQQEQDALVDEQMQQPWTGTRVILHLREDADDYLEDYRLKELLKKYSEFLQVPIYLLGERVEYERVPDADASREGPPPAGPPKFKTVTNRFNEWVHLNTQPPIWRRPEESLKEKDYVDFYKATFKAGAGRACA